VPLFQYYFKRIEEETSLEDITAVTPYTQMTYSEIYYSGYTLYWRQSPAPPYRNLPQRLKTEHWYAYIEVERERKNTIKKVLKLLTTLPFCRSVGDFGEEIPPIPLPIKKKPIGRPKKVIIPLRQIIVCQDLQLIAKLRGER
jgi:hypothetical protein